MKKSAYIGPLAALIIGIVATVVVGGIGFAVSVRVSNNQQDVEIDCCLNKSNTYKKITINADKGKLYYALENSTSTKNKYIVQYKASSSGKFQTKWSGAIASNHMIGYNYAGTASGWTKRYFNVQQTSNLSSKTSHCYFYAEVRR